MCRDLDGVVGMVVVYLLIVGIFMMLIILYMLRVICVIAGCVAVFAADELTKFDYAAHGADWDCPKNGIYLWLLR